MDPDPNPAIFVIDLQKANIKLIFFNKVFLLITFDGTFTSFFKDKKSERSHKRAGIKVFLLFLLDDKRIWIQIQSRVGSGSGSIPLTSGSRSGSGMPKIMWIQWIRIRIRMDLEHWFLV